MSEQSESRPAGRHVAVTGASGFIGSALVDALRRDGHRVSRLVRREARAPDEIGWSPQGGRVDAAALEEVDAVVHLAGESVGQRWTAEVKRRIRESRVEGTRLLAETLASLGRGPEVFLSASAVGIYGDRGDERLTEGSLPGSDFLATVGQQWEAAAEPAARAGIRVAHPRFGVVLHPEGGALERMLPPFRLGAGGRLGSGEQWMSWISLPDTVAALRFLLDARELSGPFNVVAPEPVTNRELTEELGEVLGRPTLFPVPAMALRLLFGEMADATLLVSQRATPDRLLANGFTFQHPRLGGALRAALGEH